MVGGRKQLCRKHNFNCLCAAHRRDVKRNHQLRILLNDINIGPVTIVTTTNSLGETYTSTVWWLPSSATTDNTASSSKSSSGSSSKPESSTKVVSTIKSTYTTTSGSTVETLTTTYKSTVNGKVASVMSNSTNGAFAGTHIAYGAGAFAVGALLL